MNSITQCMFRSLAVLIACLVLSACARQDSDAGLFATPEAAMQAVAGLIGQQDDQGIRAVFGAGSVDLFGSGDEEADRIDAERVKLMIEQGLEFEDFDANTKIALLGEIGWPWPIPLMRDGDGWRFDTSAGREELLNRRVGRNELWTLTALHEIVEAQREYHSQGRDGNPPAYAQHFRSTEGRRDGLYWPAEDDAELSPLGILLANSEERQDGLQPFFGYFYRILSSRGPDAPGGAMDYIDEQGFMSRGFAVVAWPAKYGNSGVMTFITNRRGIIYQQDLGPETAQKVAGIQAFDPGSEWMPTSDRMLD